MWTIHLLQATLEGRVMKHVDPAAVCRKLFGVPSHPEVTASSDRPVSLLPTGALPKLFPTVSLPSTLSSLPYRSFPPAHRSSPQAISHGFPSVHPVYFPRFPLRPPNRCFHPFPPNGALPKLFHTVSLPSTLSSLPYRSFPPELSPKSLFLLNLVFG